MPESRSIARVEAMAARMRQRVLDASFHCGSATHIGGALSISDIVACLYGSTMTFDVSRPDWENRDRFILSKGHGILGLLPALVDVGLLPEDEFSTFMRNGSGLIAHPVMQLAFGIESSNGSLGQGLSMGVGLAWAAKSRGQGHRVFVLLGDGECDEGSVWEAAMSASHLNLDNLIAIIDLNGMQNDGPTRQGMDSESMAAKWKAFGWRVFEVDGHSAANVLESLAAEPIPGHPTALIATTIKGKGVAFMENNNAWHHRRLTAEDYRTATEQLTGSRS